MGMRKTLQSVWSKSLAILLSMVLVLGGIPMSPIRADETPSNHDVQPVAELQMPTDTMEATNDNVSSECDANEETSESEEESDEADAEPTSVQSLQEPSEADAAAQSLDEATDGASSVASEFKSGVLSTEVITESGQSYFVTLAYDEAARIPEGTSLLICVRDVSDVAQDASLSDLLALGEGERILEQRILDVSLEADGMPVVPASEVEVNVETNAFDPTASSSIEVFILGTDAFDGVHITPQDLTGDPSLADAVTKLSFKTRRLGTIVLASVVRSQDMDSRGPALEVEDVGAEERIADGGLSDASASDESAEMVTLLSVQEDASESTGRSQTFPLRAYGKTGMRWTNVQFVDTQRNPILSTVTKAKDIRYTGSGNERTDDNSVDLYSYADQLAPEIEDEYEFSRVFVQLAENNEKDFRYVHVADGTAIGESASILRAYFYMNSVDENASGRDYYGTWYNLANNGRLDDIYIEFYHVAPASFSAIDTRDTPVEGAEFALFTDPQCYKPFEYKHVEQKAVSDKNGLVSFGRIPQGTYYMKETVIPEGYKRSTRIYTVVVDGVTPIENVVHDDDDGSVIIADVLRMKITKEWDDGKEHAKDSVVVDVYAEGELREEVTLNADNEWTQTLDGLDPNEAYMISETEVLSDGSNVTKSWIPHIESVEKDPHSEYYRADEFQKGREYVLLTTTYGGTRAMVGGASLGTKPLETNGTQITGTVANEMLWYVDTLTQDNVIALQNVDSGKYLDQINRWTLNASYPVPLYVRHTNRDGNIRFYHRANMNAANSYYLYIWYGPSREGQVDRYMNNESQAGVFELYRKVNVRSVDVTITNKATRYPIQVKNVSHPGGAALAGAQYDLYDQETFDEADPGTPLFDSLVAGEDGYLRDEDGERLLELSAGSYLLRQTKDLSDQGYAPLGNPVKFTITRGGALRVAQGDKEFVNFDYCSTERVGDQTYPLLRIPNYKPGTIEVTLAIEGDFADMTRAFEFELTTPEGAGMLSGTVNGVATEFVEGNNRFKLAHGQTLRLEDIPAFEEYVLRQVDSGEYEISAELTQGSANLVQDADDARVVRVSDIQGGKNTPACVTITNKLSYGNVPATGIEDNTALWASVVAAVLALLAIWWILERRARWV